MARSRHLYIVRYRRAGWKSEQQKTYLRKEAAIACANRLLLRNDLSVFPLASLKLLRRPLGDVELVREWTGWRIVRDES